MVKADAWQIHCAFVRLRETGARIEIVLEYVYRVILFFYDIPICTVVPTCVREIRSCKNAERMYDGGGGRGEEGGDEDRRQAVACRRTIITNSCVISGNHLI